MTKMISEEDSSMHGYSETTKLGISNEHGLIIDSYRML